MRRESGKNPLTKLARRTLDTLFQGARERARENGWQDSRGGIPDARLEKETFYGKDIARATGSASKETQQRITQLLLKAGCLDESDERSGRRGRPRKIYNLNVRQMFRYLDEHYHKVHLPDAVLSMLKKSDARNRTAELVDGIVPLVVPGQSRTKTSALGGFGSIIWSFAFDSPLQQFSLETPDAIKRRNELLRKLTRGSRQVARALSELPTLEGFGRALVVAPYPDVRYIELRKEAPRDP